jgi:hypothetical protein
VLDTYDQKGGQNGNKKRKAQSRHHFLGGTYGPIYTYEAIKAGHRWEEVESLAHWVQDHVFISKHLDTLKQRNVDMLFHPGTHDFVAFDVPTIGKRYPQVPVYLKANTGHGKKKSLESSENDEQNKSAFLIHHFFDDVPPLLVAPKLSTKRVEGFLEVTVEFDKESKSETGKVWWMFDRPMEGSRGYLSDPFPEDQWMDMNKSGDHTWSASIKIKDSAAHIDFFSTHRKTIQHQDKKYSTYLSSPYTRLELD